LEPEPQARVDGLRCFQLNLPDAERLDAIRAGFFAPSSDPTVWRDGWWPSGAAAQETANRATPREDWWEAGCAPLLVIQGLDDRMAPPANGHALKETLGDRVQLVDLADAGHALLPEQPEAIAEAIIAFLRQH
jgi:pimeloyl-ACP methyl ester carboxylesterase